MIMKALMVILNFVVFHPPLPLTKHVDLAGLLPLHFFLLLIYSIYFYFTFISTHTISGSTTAGGGAGSALGAPVRIFADFVKDVSTLQSTSHSTFLLSLFSLPSLLLKITE